MKLFETMLVALIILLTIAMVLCMRAEKAHSAGLLCYGGNSSVACTLSDAPPEQLSVKWREISPEQRKAWQDRCKPTTHVDRYGVERYRYAQPGCEYGP